MIKYLFFCSVVILITSCNSVTEKAIPIEALNISIQQKIKQSLGEDNLLDLGIDPSASELLFNFYKKNNFNPKWINDSTLTKEGEALKIILSNNSIFLLFKIL